MRSLDHDPGPGHDDEGTHWFGLQYLRSLFRPRNLALEYLPCSMPQKAESRPSETRTCPFPISCVPDFPTCERDLLGLAGQGATMGQVG
jgi:hypothetical protein